ncbi:YceI family protein [Ignavibacteria bacterium CHB1]|nr:MAG: YceI family protein [Chlorobiota bacterium]MBV6398828.1 Protein YceI [Ignavibacteria bacterium]MCC6885000.1 YceI family protein [Ignavibacteriales bacterium]MCE7952209.1 YceI family protein [Chlorobi bacterium CHB7]MDL1886234.1 YceI family protein [Ignavibacteria bacterium CHB1]RIK49394.1 MAG: hypothetical protein DCC60_03590 [Ignavibacteriota bacterium]
MKSILKLTLSLLAFTVFFIVGCESTETIETSEKKEVAGDHGSDETEILKINKSSSIVEWIGRKVTGEHNGTVDVKSGELFLKDGKVTGGKFVIDLNTIKVLDLTDPEYNAKLTGHLKSDDFFSVDSHPEAKFEITSVFEKADATGNTHKVSGNLTIKGITKNITFPAVIKVNGQSVSTSSDFNIDRTEWDIRFRSGKFFENLGDNMINDDFNIKFKIIAE